MTIITDQQLIEKCEAFIERTPGMTPTRFGIEAAGEGGFLRSLKAGTSVSLKRANKVLSFIADHDAANSGQGGAPSPDSAAPAIDQVGQAA